jgi:hypothetical protein
MLMAMLFGQGCCTLFTGGPETVSVNSQPPGAKVEIGPYTGTTPYSMTIPRGKEYVIKATYDGQNQTEALNRTVQPLYFLNILFWPGLIVDLATGKMWHYDPETYNFSFTTK